MAHSPTPRQKMTLLQGLSVRLMYRMQHLSPRLDHLAPPSLSGPGTPLESDDVRLDR
jgi:hypothetical protein